VRLCISATVSSAAATGTLEAAGLFPVQVAIARILMRYRISAPQGSEPQINYLFTSTLKQPLPLRFEPL